ncbi:SPOR domain-containing protein [Thalassospira profundimaris]|uniref:SPOR domain-containing protein n=1 Tax=Thalassospira profundimaris TaxID=502049 RepID=UPI00028725E9|nr:SPOR domain-containing protein [Thalassospira profundimaris]EKF07797.1 sporulation domain-containing protein [Thalassospira profundimaris WP0211]
MAKPPHAYPTPATQLSQAIGFAGMWGGFSFSVIFAAALMTAMIFNLGVVAQTLAPETGPTGIDIIPTDLPARASSVRSGNQPLSLLPGTIPTETRLEEEIEIPSLADQYQRTINGKASVRSVQPVRQRVPKPRETPISPAISTSSPAHQTTQPAVTVQRTTASDLVETATPVSAVSGGGFRIQLGAFRDTFTAETYWASFSIRYPELAKSHDKKIISADLGSQGIYHRLQLAGFEDSESAQKQCRQLKADGTDCFATAR